MQSLLGNSFVGQTTDDICKKRLASEHYGRAMAILELLMIKCGVCWTYQDCHFIVHDIDVMVDIFVLRNYVAL